MKKSLYKITSDDINKLSYVEFMALIEEVNLPPGGKDSIRRLIKNCFIVKDDLVLDVGCNTGYCSLELAKITNCNVVGVDINKKMIATARRLVKREGLEKLVRFQVADAQKLRFKDNNFDTVVCGGSTAFINNKLKAIFEYKRVTKPWGFIGETNFYYDKKPPTTLIKKLNNLMDVKIELWSKDYWLSLYKKAELEKYYIFDSRVNPVISKEIKQYSISMAKNIDSTPEVQEAIIGRLEKTMLLFNENHKYLAYSIFVLRKRLFPEQVTLFGT